MSETGKAIKTELTPKADAAKLPAWLPLPGGSTEIGRRSFIKVGAAAFALPALCSANELGFQQEEGLMEITRLGTQASKEGPSDWFTGETRIDPLFAPHEPARAGGASVTFEPGARTAWHTHPLGQVLIVTSGLGRVQTQGQPIEELRPGDVVWFPPGEKHWHGASPNMAMTHIAIQEALHGKVVEWMEHVTDEEYEGNAV